MSNNIDYYLFNINSLFKPYYYVFVALLLACAIYISFLFYRAYAIDSLSYNKTVLTAFDYSGPMSSSINELDYKFLIKGIPDKYKINSYNIPSNEDLIYIAAKAIEESFLEKKGVGQKKYSFYFAALFLIHGESKVNIEKILLEITEFAELNNIKEYVDWINRSGSSALAEITMRFIDYAIHPYSKNRQAQYLYAVYIGSHQLTGGANDDRVLRRSNLAKKFGIDDNEPFFYERMYNEFALHLYRNAIEPDGRDYLGNNTDALYRLGKLYYNGEFIENSIINAYKYLSKAASQGSNKAESLLENIQGEIIYKALMFLLMMAVLTSSFVGFESRKRNISRKNRISEYKERLSILENIKLYNHIRLRVEYNKDNRVLLNRVTDKIDVVEEYMGDKGLKGCMIGYMDNLEYIVFLAMNKKLNNSNRDDIFTKIENSSIHFKGKDIESVEINGNVIYMRNLKKLHGKTNSVVNGTKRLEYKENVSSIFDKQSSRGKEYYSIKEIIDNILGPIGQGKTLYGKNVIPFTK